MYKFTENSYTLNINDSFKNCHRAGETSVGHVFSYKYEDQNSTPEPMERLGMVILASYGGTG